MGEKSRIRLNVNLDASWARRLHMIAGRDDRTVSDLVREAIRLYLQRDERSKVGPIADYGPMSDDAQTDDRNLEAPL